MGEAWKNDPRFADHPNFQSIRLWIILALAFTATIFMIRSASRKQVHGGRAEYKWTLEDLDGRPVSFEQYAGKPVFLNIWATWCPPCREEMPSIAKLAENPKLAKVAFVCVSTDEKIESVRDYVQANKLPMTILRAKGEVPPVFYTEGIPATFILAPDGRILRDEVGGRDWNKPDVIRLLSDLAAEAK